RLVARAKHWAMKVLAAPGGPSSSTWPPQNSAVSNRSTASSWPTMALATSALTALATALTSSSCTRHLQSPSPRPLGQRRQSQDVLHLQGLGGEGRDALLCAHPFGPAVEELVERLALQVRRPERRRRPLAAQLHIAA